jgi:hypothetical protein
MSRRQAPAFDANPTPIYGLSFPSIPNRHPGRKKSNPTQYNSNLEKIHPGISNLQNVRFWFKRMSNAV